MNLRRGVLRLWLVLSLCWIVGVGVFAWGYEQTMASRDQALRACFEARKAEGTDMFSCFLDETPYPALGKTVGEIRCICVPPSVSHSRAWANRGVARRKGEGREVGRSAAAP
jgi:hypothetical protein